MKDRFVLPTFRSECSDFLQGEDETSMRHLSFRSECSDLLQGEEGQSTLTEMTSASY